MVKFNDLFRFSKKEVATFFSKSKLKTRNNGLKLLVVELHDNEPQPAFGRLLIVTPRTCGKANLRNQLRRRVKNIFYTNKLFLYPQTSVLIVSQCAMQLSFDQLRDFLLKNIGPQGE